MGSIHSNGVRNLVHLTDNSEMAAGIADPIRRVEQLMDEDPDLDHTLEGDPDLFSQEGQMNAPKFDQSELNFSDP